jgi:nitroreductase
VSEEKFKQSKFDKLARKIKMSSHIIMIGCKHDVEVNLPKWEEIAAVSCAVQNIYLSATAAGFGGYWSSPSFIIANANKYFNLDEDEVCLGMFYIGIPKDVLPPQIVKRDIDDKIKWY